MDPAVNFEADVVDVERGSDMPCVESMLMYWFWYTIANEVMELDRE